MVDKDERPVERRAEAVPEFVLVAEAAILRAFREKLFSKHEPVLTRDLLLRVASRVPLRQSDLESAMRQLVAAGAVETIDDVDGGRMQLTDVGRDRVSALGFGIRPARNDWQTLANCMRQVEMRLSGKMSFASAG